MKLKALILAAALASNAMGQTPVTLTFDEVPVNTLVNGMTITKTGITFTFSNPSLFLSTRFTASAPSLFVQDPVIEGSNYTSLGITFSVPGSGGLVPLSVSNLSFGFSVDSLSAVATLANVTLFNNGTQLGSPMSFSSSHTGTGFAEGQFIYNGSLGPVTRILITPPTGQSFAATFDNLTVTPAGPTVPAATPLTLALTAICLAGLTLLLLRKQAA
jgi:hypothetical protein